MPRIDPQISDAKDGGIVVGDGPGCFGGSAFLDGRAGRIRGRETRIPVRRLRNPNRLGDLASREASRSRERGREVEKLSPAEPGWFE